MGSCKPAVPKHFLLILAGSTWLGVGLMLMALAISWLARSQVGNVEVMAVCGVILALLIHHLGFLKIAEHNLQRIRLMNPRSCVFAFISVMVSMGAILRHSAFPKLYLSVLYTGIGLALVLSSVRYFRTFFQQRPRL
jgi:hypothetical protein